MKDIRIYTLFSGSSGNCHYIRLGDCEMLVDAGKNAKAITEALASIGADIQSIRTIYITHEHTDHTSAIRVLQRKNASVRLCMHPLCSEKIAASGAVMENIRYIPGGECISDGEILVRTFPVPHDSCACLGYRIEYRKGEELFSIGIATDIGHLTRDIAEGLYGCDCVIVESNHDTKMLANGPYPDYLKARIFSAEGHLPNDGCAKLCGYLAKSGTRHMMLAHLSRENNAPDLALRLTREAVADASVSIVYADPDRPVCLYDTTIRKDSIC